MKPEIIKYKCLLCGKTTQQEYAEVTNKKGQVIQCYTCTVCKRIYSKYKEASDGTSIK